MILFLVMIHLPAQQAAPHTVTFRYENDVFNMTDEYYTQGVHLGYRAPFIARSPVSRVLLKLGRGTTQGSLFVEQECYTPSSIRRDTVLTGDRPFAAALFAGQSSTSTDPLRGLRVTSSLILGALGPCASCAEEQRGIHRALDNIEPLGWQFQIASAFIANYGAAIEKRLFHLPWAEGALGPVAELGTYRTNAGLFGSLELGRFLSRFEADTAHAGSLHVSAFAEGSARAIGYDATLQGGPFDRESPYTLEPDELEPVVLNGSFGIRLAYGSLRLTCSRSFITREFRTGSDHGWGGFLLAILF